MRFILAVGMVLFAFAAQAGEPLRLEVGKTRMFRLDVAPTVIVVGNPRIADVIVEQPSLLFLVGLEPGETNLFVLDGEGKILIGRPILVAPQEDRQITVTRGVEDSTLSCDPRCAAVANQIGAGATTPTNPAAPTTGGDAADDAQPSQDALAAAAAAAAAAAQQGPSPQGTNYGE